MGGNVSMIESGRFLSLTLKHCIGGLPTLEAMKGADRPFLMSSDIFFFIFYHIIFLGACHVFYLHTLGDLLVDPDLPFGQPCSR